MTLYEILEIIRNNFAGGSIFAAVILTLLQVSSIKFNPWTIILKGIGKLLNGDITEHVNNLQSELILLNNKFEERNITTCRTRILRFGEEILYEDRLHTKEHFDQIMNDIDSYESYCEGHPLYKNNVAVLTIKRIKDVYQKCLETNNFL